MSTPTSLAEGTGTDGSPTDSAPGSLQIADRVVEKIAAHAAAEIDSASGGPRRVLGLAVRGPQDQPSVSAHVDGDVATVSIDMSVAWPDSVPAVTRQVRRHVADRLEALAGVTTAQIDIRVVALPVPRRAQGRVS